LRIRRDVVFVSSVLFTIVFVWAMPIFLADAWTWRRSTFHEADQLWVENYVAPLGFTSLAIILVGLIVAWTGYLRRSAGRGSSCSSSSGYGHFLS
jgi:hypothetical protein